MRIKWKNPFKKELKPSIFEEIDCVSLNEQELKAWLRNETTIKMLRLLKVHRKEYLNGLVENPNQDTSLVLGRCKGYDDIIELIEETASNQEDIEAILENYINNRNEKL